MSGSRGCFLDWLALYAEYGLPTASRLQCTLCTLPITWVVHSKRHFDDIQISPFINHDGVPENQLERYT